MCIILEKLDISSLNAPAHLRKVQILHPLTLKYLGGGGCWSAHNPILHYAYSYLEIKNSGVIEKMLYAAIFFVFVWDNIRACTCILNQTKFGCKMLRFRAESLDGIDLQETGRFSEIVQK